MTANQIFNGPLGQFAFGPDLLLIAGFALVIAWAGLVARRLRARRDRYVYRTGWLNPAKS